MSRGTASTWVLLGRRARAAALLAYLPARDPMPEAWDEPHYDGSRTQTPNLWLKFVEHYIQVGMADEASFWLSSEGEFVRSAVALGMPSWTARIDVLRSQLAWLRAYQAVNGPGPIVLAAHLAASTRSWRLELYALPEGAVRPHFEGGARQKYDQ